MRVAEDATRLPRGTARTTERPSVAYVVRSFPRLSQTFVLGEMLALERLGTTIRLFAMTDPRERIIQREVGDLRAEVRYLEHAPGAGSAIREHVRAAAGAPRGYLSAIAEAIRQRGAHRGYHVASTRDCLGYAVRLANEIRAGEVRRIHAHFAHDPTLVALLAHHLTGVPYSFTAHARDVYQVPPALLARRARRAVAVVTCSETAARHVRGVVGPGLHDRVHVVHHGVDVRAFTPAAPRRVTGTPMVVSVGRLVEKKGFADLLHALRRVRDAGTRFRCRIYGDGPLRAQLIDLTRALTLEGSVSFPGPRAGWQLVRELRNADVFALTPHPIGDGDVDGIPNVILEAMAAGLPVVATTAGGITEAVTSGDDGLLAEPGDVEEIARALHRLLLDDDLRRRLGLRARRTATERFDHDVAAAELVSVLEGHGTEPQLEREILR